MKTLQIGIFAFLFSANLFAQTIAYNSTNGTAIKGYDPVAYFSDQKATEGKNEFAYDWSGSKWLFSSQSNLDAFKADPQKYAPQYGGFCAYGVSENTNHPQTQMHGQLWTVNFISIITRKSKNCGRKIFQLAFKKPTNFGRHSINNLLILNHFF